jgi:predicted permease
MARSKKPISIPLALRIAARLLPRDAREDVLGDLVEMWQEQKARRSRVGCMLWTWRQPLIAIGARLALRARPKRDGRVPTGGGISWIDVKLGLRLLAKHPIMTLVSGLAVSVTIAVAIGMFTFFQSFILRPTLPLDEGDRVVSLGLLNTRTNRSDWRLLHEFEVWRDELRTLEDLAIWRDEMRNVVGPDGGVAPLPVTLMTASGFDVARVAPLLGRPLMASDEVEGASPVVVLGHREWTTRFARDPDVVGTQIQMGRDTHTIVGVMPEGFTFPFSARFWIPLRDDPDNFPILTAPSSNVFARLRPGVTAEQAQAELDVISQRRAAELPDTHANLVGKIMSYTDPYTGMDNATGGNWIGRVVLGVLTLVVLIPFANVAILVYARTATRTGEISIRTALGASRRRVVTQLFVEALVLSTMSAAAGVGIVFLVLGQIERFMDVYMSSSLPFWFKSGTDPWAVAYVVGLTVLAAVVAGVIPGLRATGANVQANIRGAGSGMRLGRLWTALVVTQVAITVAFLPVAGSVARFAVGAGMSEPRFATSQYATAVMNPAQSTASESDRKLALDELVRRLEDDPRVRGVGLSTRIPGSPYSASAQIEVEGFRADATSGGHPVGITVVSANLFDVLQVPLLDGRGFTPSDGESTTLPVIVDQTFVTEVLSGANPVGLRVRARRPTEEEPGPWSEIVGVVADLVDNPMSRSEVGGMIYYPLSAANTEIGLRLVIHAPGAPDEVAAELPRLAASVDQNLWVSMPGRIAIANDPLRVVTLGLAVVIGLVLTSVLLLCSAGVFALMSFNVTQRRREIGIRSALGASPERVLAKVMARSARQLLLGVAVGVGLVAMMPDLSIDGLIVEIDSTLIVTVAGLLVIVGLLAAAGPTRAGLRVQPTEALREM